MSKSQRDKGNAGENEFIRRIRGTYKDARRNLGESGSQLLGVDVLAGALRVQVKRWKDYAPISKLFEVPQAADTIPVLATRGDRKEWIVCLRLSDFLALSDDIAIVYEGTDPNVPPF